MGGAGAVGRMGEGLDGGGKGNSRPWRGGWVGVLLVLVACGAPRPWRPAVRRRSPVQRFAGR
jgi:hypothetical protein